MSDRNREIHFDPNEHDAPSDGEILAELRETEAALAGGDLSVVPPWMSKEECTEDLMQQIERLVAKGVA